MKFHSLAVALTVSIPLAAAFVGQMTHYTPSAGAGSCGVTASDNDDIVALSIPVMANGVNPNANPKCGTKISIYNPDTKATHWATIVDTCYACKEHDLDVSPALFSKIAPSGDGRVSGIMWGGDKTGG